jgi:putative transposase
MLWMDRSGREKKMAYPELNFQSQTPFAKGIIRTRQMKQSQSTTTIPCPPNQDPSQAFASSPPSWRSALDEFVFQGAQKMLQKAIEDEVARYLAQTTHLCDEHGHRLVVRNGFQPAREIATGAGRIEIRRPRVHDRRPAHAFTSSILPPYMRRSPTIDTLIPVLYLKGVSTGDMSEALEAILGSGSPGLSSATIVRLKEFWSEEYQSWSRRDLTGIRYLYFWADGIYFNVRLDEDRPCMLVIMGAREDGTKELVGLLDGERESILSWKELLLDLKGRGLTIGPELATGDGGLGFWPALEEVYGATRHQRCWVHKIANVLDKMPKGVQPQAKRILHDMYESETREKAQNVMKTFTDLYGERYPKAEQCLVKDKEVLLTYYDFPMEHWQHIRSTNPIESAFSTVRHRTRQTKGCGSREATLTMVYKLSREAEKRWRKLNGVSKLGGMVRGVPFKDGLEVISQAA